MFSRTPFASSVHLSRERFWKWTWKPHKIRWVVCTFLYLTHSFVVSGWIELEDKWGEKSWDRTWANFERETNIKKNERQHEKFIYEKRVDFFEAISLNIINSLYTSRRHTTRVEHGREQKQTAKWTTEWIEHEKSVKISSTRSRKMLMKLWKSKRVYKSDLLLLSNVKWLLFSAFSSSRYICIWLKVDKLRLSSRLRIYVKL